MPFLAKVQPRGAPVSAKQGAIKPSPTGFLAKVAGGATDDHTRKIAALVKEDAAARRNTAAENDNGTIAKRTLTGIPRATLQIPGMIGRFGAGLVKDAAEVSLTAAEALPRLWSPRLRGAAAPPLEIPGLSRITGPIESYQTQAVKAKRAGASDFKAAGSGVVKTLLNEPFGVAAKPLFIAGGFLARTALKNRRAIQDAARLAEDAIRTEKHVLPVVSEASPATRIPIRPIGATRIPVTAAPAREVPVPNALRYQAESELPVIQMGARAKNALPTIKLPEAPVKAPPGFKYEPIPAPKAPEAPVASVAPREAPIVPASAPEAIRDINPAIPEPRTTPRITGEEIPSVAKAASDINKKLVEKGFDEIQESELAKFSSITKGQQTQRVASLMDADAEAVKLMAQRKLAIPNDVNPQVLYNAVKNKAIAEADAETMRALAKSPIATERSVAAQTLGASGFDNGIADPVEAMAEIARTRIKAAASKGVKNAEAIVKKEVAAAKKAIKSVPKESWASFIDSIVCP